MGQATPVGPRHLVAALTGEVFTQHLDRRGSFGVPDLLIPLLQGVCLETQEQIYSGEVSKSPRVSTPEKCNRPGEKNNLWAQLLRTPQNVHQHFKLLMGKVQRGVRF